LKEAAVKSGLVDVAFVTLDPARDSVETLKKKYEALELTPNWHLLTGDSKSINQILDQYQVARAPAEGGTIGHSNLFYVIDKKGKIAFKIGLGSVQQKWLRQALDLLVREEG